MKIFESNGTFIPADFGLPLDTEFSVICVGGGTSGYCQHTTATSLLNLPNYSLAGGNSGKISFWSGKITGNVPVTVGLGGVPVRKQTTGYGFGGRFPGAASSFGAYCTAAGASDSDFSSAGGLVNGYTADYNSRLGGAGGAGGFVIGSGVRFGNGGHGMFRELYSINVQIGNTSTSVGVATPPPNYFQRPDGNGGVGGGSPTALLYVPVNATNYYMDYIDLLAGMEAQPGRTNIAGIDHGSDGRGYGAGGGGTRTGPQTPALSGGQYQLLYNSNPGKNGVVIVTW